MVDVGYFEISHSINTCTFHFTDNGLLHQYDSKQSNNYFPWFIYVFYVKQGVRIYGHKLLDYAIQYNTIQLGIVSCLFCKKFHLYNNFQIQIIAIPADIHLKNSNLFLLIFREFF